MNETIRSVQGYEVLDSRGNPTMMVRVALHNGVEASALVPSGASTGAHEAVELRDDDARYQGKGVQTAVRHVNEVIAPHVIGLNVSAQREIDQLLQSLDGTVQKSRLGANAILGVSLAVARAAAQAESLPFYRYLGGVQAARLPVPLLNVLNGGVHADNNVDIQEFMVVPAGATSFAEAMRMASETYQSLKSLLKQKGLRTAVGDEGGFAPDLKDNREALDLLLEAMSHAGLAAGKDMALAIDVAASELYREGRYWLQGQPLTADELVRWYQDLVAQYPAIVSIEDGLAEDDWAGWKVLGQALGSQVQLVGDDIFVTNPDRIERGIQEQVANAVLIKLNQIGTVSETLEAIHKTHQAGWESVVSHRSGETEDTSIADLTVAVNSSQMKSGAPARGERIAKYNRLMVIEADDPTLVYTGWEAFRR
jgi:enolase